MLKVIAAVICWYYLPTISIRSTKLVSIVPPVANAHNALNTINSQYQGANAAPTPLATCKTTAHISGFLRPNLQNQIR